MTFTLVTNKCFSKWHVLVINHAKVILMKMNQIKILILTSFNWTKKLIKMKEILWKNLNRSIISEFYKIFDYTKFGKFYYYSELSI